MKNVAHRILREPLVHFLAAGLLLFALFAIVSPKVSLGDRVIVVEESDLVLFVRHRYGKFAKGEAETFLNSLPVKAWQTVIDDFVREEVLYREAKAMQLDRIDYSARQRLVTQFESIQQGLVRDSIALSEDDLRTFYRSHIDRYRQPAYQTFSTAQGSAEHRSFPHRYERQTQEAVAESFGGDFASRVFELPVDASQWVGPLPSKLGHHMVLIEARSSPVVPPYDEVRALVLEDATADSLRTEEARRLAVIRARYEVVLSDTMLVRVDRKK
jgi:peptidyl-prolyl cis-trans isomerase C